MKHKQYNKNNYFDNTKQQQNSPYPSYNNGCPLINVTVQLNNPYESPLYDNEQQKWTHHYQRETENRRQLQSITSFCQQKSRNIANNDLHERPIVVLRNLPTDATELSIIEMALKFGSVVYIIYNQRERLAEVEFERTVEATAMVRDFQSPTITVQHSSKHCLPKNHFRSTRIIDIIIWAKRKFKEKEEIIMPTANRLQDDLNKSSTLVLTQQPQPSIILLPPYIQTLPTPIGYPLVDNGLQYTNVPLNPNLEYIMLNNFNSSLNKDIGNVSATPNNLPHLNDEVSHDNKMVTVNGTTDQVNEQVMVAIREDMNKLNEEQLNVNLTTIQQNFHNNQSQVESQTLTVESISQVPLCVSNQSTAVEAQCEFLSADKESSQLPLEKTKMLHESSSTIQVESQQINWKKKKLSQFVDEFSKKVVQSTTDNDQELTLNRHAYSATECQCDNNVANDKFEKQSVKCLSVCTIRQDAFSDSTQQNTIKKSKIRNTNNEISQNGLGVQTRLMKRNSSENKAKFSNSSIEIVPLKSINLLNKNEYFKQNNADCGVIYITTSNSSQSNKKRQCSNIAKSAKKQKTNRR